MKPLKLLKKKSWRIVAMFLATVVVLVGISRPAPVQAPRADTQASHINDSFYITNKVNPTFQDMGQISIIYCKGQIIHTLFTADNGKIYEVLSQSPTEYLDYDGEFVNIWGTVAKSADNTALPQLYVASMMLIHDSSDNQAVVNNAGEARMTGVISFLSEHEAYFTDINGQVFLVGNNDPNYFYGYNGDLVSISYIDVKSVLPILRADGQFISNGILIKDVEIIQSR